MDETNEKQIRKAFTKFGEFPKILIVTEKLLTGFDAPILYAMYLDKPMRDHTLLQAIARVNRVHEGKDYGLIVDYYGILDHLDEALEVYTDGKDDLEAHLESVLTNIDVGWKDLDQDHARVWDIFKVVANKENIVTDPGYLEWAGVAVFKKTYAIFRERGYRIRLLSAGFRNHMHWSEFIGGDVVISFLIDTAPG